jgi:predicted neuraminidase
MLTKGPIFERLPGRPAAHCATVHALRDGSLLAAWFGGSRELASDVVLLAATYAGERWTAPRVIAAVPGKALGQPVFLELDEGTLWLYFDVVMDRKWITAQPHRQRSIDSGLTWSAPEPVLDYPGLMFRTKPVQLPGRIVLPVYDENTWESRMLLSDDGGTSWRLTDPLRSPQGNIQPATVHLENGHLLAYMRTGGDGGVIWRAESRDGGETWTTPEATDMPNPNSSIDLLRLASGALALAYNPSRTARTPLAVAYAAEGERWDAPHIIEDAPGQFSYPMMTQAADGMIHLVYTYQLEHIHHAAFSEGWLRDQSRM